MKIYAYKGKDNLCGERIRLARAKNRIIQSDLAARMQVAGVAIERDSISRIERGTRIVTDYELKIFSKALGVSMEWLQGEIEKRKRDDDGTQDHNYEISADVSENDKKAVR
jgi:transcriptional regulator with XRE-family HTH domain